MNRKLNPEELNRPSIEEYRNSEKMPIVIILDNIRSLNNIGSVFRTADAFLVEEIHLCGITATPPHREIQKTALGATESVKWRHFDSGKSSIENLKKRNFTIVAVEQTESSILLQEFPVIKKEKLALVFGNEVTGVSEEIIKVVNHCIQIPQFGTKHSLNISVCAGIVIWEIHKKISG